MLNVHVTSAGAGTSTIMPNPKSRLTVVVDVLTVTFTEKEPPSEAEELDGWET
jgi:hypothetical protein